MIVKFVQPGEARELCSDSEWKLVESSFSPVVEMLPPSALKLRIDRVSKLHRKVTDLVTRQHSESRKSTTRRKSELFAEAVGRFEAAQNTQIERGDSAAAVLKNLDNRQTAGEARVLDVDALRMRSERQAESRKSQVRSTLGVRGQQQGNKSGERRIQSHIGSATRRQQGRRDSKNG